MKLLPLIALLGAAALAACGEDESNPIVPIEPAGTVAVGQVVTRDGINASNTDTLVRFSLATNAIVQGTSDWDIAFRRYEVRLNGGVTGTAGVTGFSIGNNRNSTAAQVLAFTLENTRAAFDSVTLAQAPADSAFVSDRLVANSTAYLNLAGAPTANGNAYWKVKTATGAFALVRVSQIVLTGNALTSLTIERRLQSGTTLGAASAFTVPIGSAPVAIDIAGGAAVTASGCNWDLQVTPQSFGISVNAACNAGTYPGPASPTFVAATAAGDAPQYAAYLAGLTGPVPNSITDTSAPFRYNLAGTNRLDPAFNTYLIRNGTRLYKLQLTGYYSASGASGYPSIRYARLR